MKSKKSSSVNLHWHSSLSELVTGRSQVTVEKLVAGGIDSLLELLWQLPLRIHRTPELQPFREAILGRHFRGSGKVIHVDVRPAFGRRTKGRFLLYNGYLVVKDDLSSETLTLRWFNLYPNQKKQIEALERCQFIGLVEEYKAQKQIINPQLSSESDLPSDYLIEYPTINKVPGSQLRKIIDLIPAPLWNDIPQALPALGYDERMPLGEALQTFHGRIPANEFSPEKKQSAEERLIYEEFLVDQLKIITRRSFIKQKTAPRIQGPAPLVTEIIQKLPFELTDDQWKVFAHIQQDLASGHPMMRMIQGDVGCGKTVVAYLAAALTIQAGLQVAIMCPTEALATQHFETFRTLDPALRLGLLLGSTKAKERQKKLAALANGELDLIIGTHALFQPGVEFRQLGLAVIDEQHKFGVEQRLKLIAKGEGTHCLIMTATPIPRTLSLAQYGDLDISSIRTMPAGRKGIKTRITEKVNYGKYLEFVRARLAQGEQAYFVFPAIEESEVLDIQNVSEGLGRYQEFFKEFKVAMLHGKMKSEEKEATVEAFRCNRVQILISTSVIEVGINVANATVMSIYNPERFGLSSLHQLRGRVGRADKPGFCFLVLDREVSPEALARLKVLETTLDGFAIAEEDLKFRGEGDLFGVDQSGIASGKKLANYLTHTPILEQVVDDLAQLQKTRFELLRPVLERLAKDQKILDTI